MSAGDLTTLANVKTWLGLSSDAGPNDGLLGQLITAASAFVVSYCGRAILSAGYTEVYDGTGAGWMLLRQAPITEVIDKIAAAAVAEANTWALKAKAALAPAAATPASS